MTTQAIIIKKQNINEYDQLVTCYTKEFGKLTAIAKSILKPTSIQALHLDSFNLVEFDLISGKGMPIITGAQLIDSFGGIKNTIARTAVAYFFTEVLDKMIFENDKDEKLWSFLVSFLSNLNVSNEPVRLLREGQSNLLNILGYWPDVKSCRACESVIDLNSYGAFNYNLGGIICKKCFLSGYGGILISQSDYRLIKGSAVDFSGKNYKISILDGMFEYVSGGKFFSLDLLKMCK